MQGEEGGVGGGCFVPDVTSSPYYNDHVIKLGTFRSKS